MKNKFNIGERYIIDGLRSYGNITGSVEVEIIGNTEKYLKIRFVNLQRSDELIKKRLNEQALEEAELLIQHFPRVEPMEKILNKILNTLNEIKDEIKKQND